MKIIIIGGGFAGINLALKLGNKKDIEVILVDKNNYNFFPPLIYQVSTSFLEPSNISYPFRKLIRRKKNIRFHMGDLVKIIPTEKKVVLTTEELTYDYLVLATGTETNYFGLKNVQQNALSMKTVYDAINMRNILLQRMEKASVCSNKVDVSRMLTIVIAGGGPTGVELCGMFGEMRKNIMNKEYPELAGKGGRIILIDGSETLLSPMSKKAQQYAYDKLEELGIEIRLNLHVKDFVDNKVYIDNGDVIEAETLIWAAGVTGKIFEGIPTESYARGKRIKVDVFNKIDGLQDVYAIGDCCVMTADKNFPDGHPQLAQVAIQQGKLLAKNFIGFTNKEEPKSFSYYDKGTLAIIGRNKAVADLPKPELHLKGFVAWFMWLFVHLLFLISYRNRIKTFFNWVNAYFSKDQSLRLIIKPDTVSTMNKSNAAVR